MRTGFRASTIRQRLLPTTARPMAGCGGDARCRRRFERDSCASAPTVQVGGGMIRGLMTDGGGAAFKGIPYAQPPVGDLRWREHWVNFVRGGDRMVPASPRGQRSAARLVGSCTFSPKAQRPRKDCGVPSARSIWRNVNRRARGPKTRNTCRPGIVVGGALSAFRTLIRHAFQRISRRHSIIAGFGFARNPPHPCRKAWPK